MKRKVLALVLIMIIALSIASWFVYSQISELQNQVGELQHQNSELQNQKTELQEQISNLTEILGEFQNPVEYIKITGFEWESGFSPMVCLTLANKFNVTVENRGVNDVSGLSLDVRFYHNGTELVGSGFYTESFDMLHGWESLKINGVATSNLNNRPSGTECVIALRLGDVVLDEHSEVIVWSVFE